MAKYWIVAIVILYGCTKSKSDQPSIKADSTTKTNSNHFRVHIDTLSLHLNGDLRKAALFRGNFYLMLETNRVNTTGDFKKMSVFSPKGKFIEDVFIPKAIQDMIYYDLIVYKDSLYIKETEFEKTNFLLGEYVADFEEVKRREIPIFQDSVYNIYATCNGEWGGTIYFQNKHTKQVYEARSTCPEIVNKLGSEYYITNYMGHMIGFASVLKISDPTKLQKSTLDFNTELGSKYDKGVENLMDTAAFYIPTSLIVNKKLYHLYSDKQGTYIGEIIKGKPQPVFQFDFQFSTDLSQNLSDGRQVLTCYFLETKDKKLKVKDQGILLINQNNFNFYLLK